MLNLETPHTAPFVNEPMKKWLRAARGSLSDKEYVLYEEILWAYIDGETSLIEIGDRLGWHRHTFRHHRETLRKKGWIDYRHTFGKEISLSWVKRPGSTTKPRTPSPVVHITGPGQQVFKVKYKKLAAFEREHGLPRLFFSRLVRLHRLGTTPEKRNGPNKEWEVVAVIE